MSSLLDVQDVRFIPGLGSADSKGGDIRLSLPPSRHGAFIFLNAERTVELVRFDPDGKCYVRGELCEDNQAIYAAVRWCFIGSHVVDA